MSRGLSFQQLATPSPLPFQSANLCPPSPSRQFPSRFVLFDLLCFCLSAPPLADDATTLSPRCSLEATSTTDARDVQVIITSPGCPRKPYSRSSGFSSVARDDRSNYFVPSKRVPRVCLVAKRHVEATSTGVRR